MTTLLNRSQTLDAKLRALELAKRHAADMQLIQQRTGEWTTRHARLKAVATQTSLLQLLDDDANQVTSKQASLRQNAGKVLARLNEDGDIKELTRDAAWTRLLKSSEGLAEELETAGRNAWQAYLEQVGTLETPATLTQRTPPTPQNDEALTAYRASHAAFVTIARLPLPRTPEDLHQLATHAAACRQAFEGITFDLPADVRAFYEAIHAGTATLSDVTSGALDWLSAHGHLKRFRVRSASS